MLDQAIKEFHQDGDKARFFEAIREFYGLDMVDPYAENYLCNPNEEKGIFKIDPFSKSWKAWTTCDKLFGRFGDRRFPGICIGYDVSGVEFWLMLDYGQVITLHHDASFSEVAWEIETDDFGSFLWEFISQGSVFYMDDLLALQRASRDLDKDAPDFGQKFLEATAKSLGWSIERLKRNIHSLPLEMIYNYCRDD